MSRVHMPTLGVFVVILVVAFVGYHVISRRGK